MSFRSRLIFLKVNDSRYFILVFSIFYFYFLFPNIYFLEGLVLFWFFHYVTSDLFIYLRLLILSSNSPASESRWRRQPRRQPSLPRLPPSRSGLLPFPPLPPSVALFRRTSLLFAIIVSNLAISPQDALHVLQQPQLLLLKLLSRSKSQSLSFLLSRVILIISVRSLFIIIFCHPFSFELRILMTFIFPIFASLSYFVLVLLRLSFSLSCYVFFKTSYFLFFLISPFL